MLPPGPEQNPFAQVTAFHRDPLGVLRAHQQEFGDVFTVRFPTARPTLVVADPAAAQLLAHGDPELAHAGDARRHILPQASPRSSFGADGPQHRTAKARLQPAFAPTRIDALRPQIAALAAAHAASWPTGRPFRLMQRTRLLADEITTRLVLGMRDDGRARELAVAIRRMLAIPGNPPMSPPGAGQGLVGALGAQAAQRRMRPVLAMLAAELDTRRAAGDVEGDDLLGCLLRAPELDTETAVDELLPVLLAAQEPMASALTWLLLRLAQEPAAAERWRADPANEREREAIVKEALRLRPAALAMLRRLTAPLEVAGHVLPAGVTVITPIVLLHRNADLYPEPDAFRPSRWLVPDPPDALHFPFGAGARRCLGEPLAHAQVEAAIPAILDRLRLRPAWPREERMVLRATILVPHRSGLVRADPR
jgi:cytochrome P450